MLNPYHILDVPTDATAFDIHAAYRKLCKVIHPDAGGGAEAFRQLSAAYDLLIDANRRRQYDEAEANSAINELNTLFVQVMSETNVDKIDQTDIIGVMTQRIREIKQKSELNLSGLKLQQSTQAKGLAKVRKRMKAKKHNFLILALEQAMAKIMVPIGQIEVQITLYEQMLVLLEDFDYEFDVVAQPTTQLAGWTPVRISL